LPNCLAIYLAVQGNNNPHTTPHTALLQRQHTLANSYHPTKMAEGSQENVSAQIHNVKLKHLCPTIR